MRPVLLALVLLAGCIGSPVQDVPAEGAPPQDAAPEGEADAAAPPVGERTPVRMESFVFLADRTIGFVPEGETLPEERVAEPLSGFAFYTAQAQGVTLSPFLSFPFDVPFETTGEFDLTLKLVATAAAVSTFPGASGFPTVGGWFGTAERFAHFVGAPDMPPSLEAGKVYEVKMRVPLPKGGFFVREGEQLAFTPYANYQTADNSPLAWVVGGAQPSGFDLPHSHFNVSAPRAIVLLDESGETGPNALPTGEANQKPASFAFSVPPEAVYVVLEVQGAPKAGARVDVDGSIRTPSGEVLAAGTSPLAREVAVVGPGALAAAGRDLVAHVTSSASPSGATFRVLVTAYAP
ncbi:MAG TPA: hypothetical protein VM582_00785 [Candidatus Thermoplasmatota archaeon]|nr:hypothetical protein [Candidatus Thermoplasmatota archaeon]